jgi:hypothetical protein
MRPYATSVSAPARRHRESGGEKDRAGRRRRRRSALHLLLLLLQQEERVAECLNFLDISRAQRATTSVCGLKVLLVYAALRYY